MDKNLTNISGKIKTAQILKSQMRHVGPKSERLPPGQRLLNSDDEFPILDLGIQPDFDPQTYSFSVTGLINRPLKLSLEELKNQFPKTYLTADFHCVTRWSKYDVKWAGIRYLDLEKFIQPLPEAKFVLQIGLDNYSTNLPILDLQKENVIIAYELYDQDLTRVHGAPLRMIVPELYAWKGAKFLTRLHYLAKDEQGFWETRGYNNHGDPWKEERYSD